MPLWLGNTSTRIQSSRHDRGHLATSTAAPLLQACTTYELVKWHAHVQPAKLFPKTFAVETVSRISFVFSSFLNFSQNVSRGCLLDVRRIHTAQGTSPPHCGCAAMCRTRCISPPHLGVVVHKKSSWELGRRIRRNWRDWRYRSFMIVSRMFFSGQAQRFKRFKRFAEVETPWGTPFLLRGLLQGP